MKPKSPLFNRIWSGWQNVQIRRKWLSIASGGLILIGLAAGRLFQAGTLEDLSLLGATLLAGWDIAGRAVRSLRNRHVSIELLVTIAALGALWIGEYWEAAAVTFLFLFGAYLEARTLSRTRQVLGSLLDLAPLKALVLRDGSVVEVAPEEVLVGESVLVKAGAKVPVDGEVIEGRSAVDESAITGEPLPEEKSPGASVYAGTVNGNAALVVQATGTGADTTLARIIRRVEEAQEEKAPTQRFIERFARWYTPAIIALSFLSYLVTRDLELALTLLVIGCPGALVISTPVSVVAGIGRAAKAGILIKGGEYLENSGKISAIAFDKTGTLTQGKPALTDILVLQPAPVTAAALALAGPGYAGEVLADPAWLSPAWRLAPPLRSDRWESDQAEVLYWAASAESGSSHPLARSILQAAELAFGPSGEPFPSETLPGKGVQAWVGGQKVQVGTASWLQSEGVEITPGAGAALDRLKDAGKTAVVVAVNGQAQGILGIADPVRPDAAEMLRRLEAAGVKKILMLTGDDARTAQAVARETGVKDVRAELLPEGKLSEIRSLQAQGYRVAMIGDGINDAPALAAADVGIAMGAAGSDVAIETADIALMADDLLKVPEAIRLSRAVLRNIYQNVLIALATVSLLLLGVLLREVNMGGGMLIHEASVLVVIFNGMRLMKLR